MAPDAAPAPAGVGSCAPSPSHAARHGDAAALAQALQDSRCDTLATFDRVTRALGGRALPQQAGLNPPLWELGHIGWFQEYWTVRNPQRARGRHADPLAARPPAPRAAADALYDSSFVPHAERWSLPLPDAQATRDDLARQLEAALAQLQAGDTDDDNLYFHRLALLHEDMHHEAALYMAQALALDVDDGRWQPAPLAAPRRQLELEPGLFTLGSGEAGFSFDNERLAHDQALPATRIDSRVLRWDEYLPFVEAGGYRDARWWSETGLCWLAQQHGRAPRDLRCSDGQWQQRRGSRWQALDPALPACHLSAHEAQAWCRWAGRRLPTEAEWERAAALCPQEFAWGSVWEWTASRFAPYAGFRPDPYRDYSAPWFGSRLVLRGASFMTQPRLRHLRYRNFFEPHRNDVPAGLRSCSL